MSYNDNKPKKGDVTKRVAELEKFSGQLATALNDTMAQLHWALTILKDMPEWVASLEKAQALVESARKLKEKAAKEEAADTEVNAEVVKPDGLVLD